MRKASPGRSSSRYTTKRTPRAWLRISQELQLDPKRFDPKKTRWAIGNAKNQGWLPDQLEANAEGQQGKLTADVYRRYRKALAANNALDFDDLLLLPVQLLQQNEQVRRYWHRRFRHVLVDEYQDTNRTQYDLIKLLVTDGKDPQVTTTGPGVQCSWWAMPTRAFTASVPLISRS